MGQICLLVFSLALGCMSQEKAAPPPSAKVREELGQEISLKADRAQLDELRKEIPAEKQQANDELALILKLMNDEKQEPVEVNRRFAYLLQKRRESFTKKSQRLRENYRREENDRRRKFLDAAKKVRDEKLKKKKKGDSHREFLAEQERERQQFFADERDRRKDFEEEMSIQSADFNSYMREKQNEFNQQFELYRQRYQTLQSK